MTTLFRYCADFRIVVRRNEHHGRVIFHDGQLFFQFQPGHPSELYVEHQAVKLWMLRVREKFLRRSVCNRMEVGGAQ